MTPSVEWTPELYNEIITLYRQGLTGTQIAAILGEPFNRSKVCGALYRMEEKRPAGWIPRPHHDKTGARAVPWNKKPPKVEAEPPAPARSLVHAVGGIISAGFNPTFTRREPRIPAGSLSGRILAHLERRASDTLDIASSCDAKESTVIQTMAVLESQKRVVGQPCTGPRTKTWRLTEGAAG